MNLIELRRDNADHVLRKKFIKRVLTSEGQSILQAQKERMNESNFTNPNFNKTSLEVTDFRATLTFVKLHRFVDMKSRKTKNGVIKKESYPIYNRIIFGHLNNIIGEISFGYTDTVIEEMKRLENN
ncbi:MAG: hypothetical protein KBT36_08735 [Kurthia sp.]|nr:hypothetical protein [Candidatus Kurthia equi]